MIPALFRLARSQRQAKLHAPEDAARASGASHASAADCVVAPEPRVRALRAAVDAVVAELQPLIGSVDSRHFRVRRVAPHEFAERVAAEPLSVARRSLRARLGRGGLLARLLPKLMGRGRDAEWVTRAAGVAYLPHRHEIIVSDAAAPEAAALRLAIIGAALHQVYPLAWQRTHETWSAATHYEPYRLVPEICPEMLLCVQGSCNAWARLVWLDAVTQLLAHLPQATQQPRRWARAVAKSLGCPIALMHKLVALYSDCPAALWRTLAEPHLIEALATGCLDTALFVPFGQAEAVAADVATLGALAPAKQALCIHELAPTDNGGWTHDVQTEPLRAAEQLLSAGFCPRAAPLIEAHLAAAPESAAGWLLQGRFLLLQGQLDAAAQCARRALQFDETAGMTHLLLHSIDLARSAPSTGRLARIVQRNRALEWSPRCPTSVLAPLRDT